IPAAVGMGEEQIYEMYRLLAIAKYEERYVIPTAYTGELPAAASDMECSLSGDGGPGMYESGPFSNTGDGPVPVAVESFHGLRQRENPQAAATNARSRVNLLNWDGRSAPPGMFPEEQKR
ncbi:MAG: nitrate reductase subunit beta, partial [Mycobacterium sp.]